jgi:nickel/cobalt transporter (NicO) family protein
MSATTPALIAAAAGVGFGHAILPDHWVPLAVIGRTQRYRLGRVARLSGLAGVAHVLVSLVLGAIIIAVGLQFRSQVASVQDAVVGGVLLLTGVGFGVLELTGRGHHHDHDHRHDHDHHHDHAEHDHHHHGRAHGLAAIMVPFGAAASPDLTILPVFVAATTAGAFAAVGALLVFSAVTIATIVTLTLVACFGGHQLQGRWLDRWGNLFTAGVLVAIGALVAAGVI